MVPSDIILMDVLPLTIRGKLDRSALPPPPHPAGEAYRAPLGEAEHAVASIWRDVLKLPEISADADFYDLAGNVLAGVPDLCPHCERVLGAIFHPP
jgi:hypothetical protein